MVNILVKHKVADYNNWKSKFDEFSEVRRAGGEQSYKIMQADNDPNNLILTFEWDNVENAQNFLGSDDLKNAMQDAGVIEAPTIHFLNIVDSGQL